MNKNLQKQESIDKSRGFVALFTVLIAAVVLAMAVGIANISLKQIVLSGSSTDANRSFYAADSGVECALFNDIRLNSFVNNANEIDCSGQLIPVFLDPFGIYKFEMEFFDGSVYSCAKVDVDRTSIDGGVRIVSRGTNNACNANNSRTVERAIEVTY